MKQVYICGDFGSDGADEYYGNADERLAVDSAP